MGIVRELISGIIFLSGLWLFSETFPYLEKHGCGVGIECVGTVIGAFGIPVAMIIMGGYFFQRLTCLRIRVTRFILKVSHRRVSRGRFMNIKLPTRIYREVKYKVGQF